MTLAQPRPVTAPVADLGAGHGPEWIDRWLAAHADDVVSWRRAIHARPELARREHETTRLVAETLAGAGLRPRLLPGTGLICDIGEGPRTVALRADIDALPLTEQIERALGLPGAGCRAHVRPRRAHRHGARRRARAGRVARRSCPAGCG